MGNKPFYKQKDLFGNSQIVFAEGKKKKTNTLFEYDDFVDKFEDKKTTDDCYTPKAVFDTVLNWLKEKGKIKDRQPIIRPFFPGNDYKEVDYPNGCIVVDNPPFSIFTEIVRFYSEKQIPFFLFGPHMTLFSCKEKKANLIIVGADIIYENGAIVKTSFASNLFGNIQAFSDYDLYSRLKALNVNKNPLPKYEYPEELMTISDFTYLLHKGVEFEVNKSECVFVSTLDSQKKYKKTIFGSGILMSKAKAKAKAKAALKKEVEKIPFILSDRENDIISKLGDSPKAGGQKNI